MAQNKFKVGDKVRIIKSDYNKDFYTRNIGKISTIEKISVGVYPYILKDIDSCWGDDELELASFTKNDLKNGDIVTYRNGKKRVVKGNETYDGDILSMYLNNYSEDLKNKSGSDDFDIVKVERTTTEVFFEEEKEILDKQEKKYLKRVIAPFRNVVQKVVKHRMFGENKDYIYFVSEKLSDCFSLPTFKAGTMYKGMEVSKEYTLEELGL